MAVYVVTGKLGAGKTLVAVGKIKDKLNQGCKVATNLDLRLDKLVGEKAKQVRCYRIPDKPALSDLESIGNGNDSYDEAKNGLLVLDECGTWFNSRSWADKERQKVINWFLHARKLGWDIIFLIQDLSIMDKQARVALAEHVVYCRRLDRLTLPFIGSLYSMFVGGKIPMPKVHMGLVRYGDTPTSLVVERWFYKGKHLYAAYDTKQAFSDTYPHATYSYLTPWLTHGVFRAKRNFRFYMKATRIYWKRFSRPLMALSGFTFGVLVTVSTLVADRLEASPEPVPESGPSLDMGRFSGAQIVGYSRLGDTQTYRVRDNDGVVLTTDDIRALGYRQSSGGSCSLTLLSGADSVQISC